MDDFHKQLLNSLIKDWTDEQISKYIEEKEEEIRRMEEWLRHLKWMRRKKKVVKDTGTRHGH